MLSKYRPLSLFLLLLCIAVLASLSLGSQSVSIFDFFDTENKHLAIIWTIRLPRTINAISVGALLSMAGLMIQNLVKNPLADPYILGVSGASASVQLALIASGLIIPFWIFMGIGFLASLLSLLLLIKISTKNSLNTHRLLLSGVVIAFAYGAVISLILTLSPLSTTKPLLFWLMGDLSHAQSSWLPFVFLSIGGIWAYKYHRELDLLARGEFFAQKCGVDVKKINLVLLISSSIFTAIAVSMAGTIGFVGLVVPHMVRLMVGNLHALLIPLCAVLGALVLLIADIFARTIVAPIQLPVGIFTALLGVPVFLYLLRHRP